MYFFVINIHTSNSYFTDVCVSCVLSTLHSRMGSEHAQMKEELELLRQDNIQLVREHNHVKQACDELRRHHEDDQREVADMRMLHQQVTQPFEKYKHYRTHYTQGNGNESASFGKPCPLLHSHSYLMGSE